MIKKLKRTWVLDMIESTEETFINLQGAWPALSSVSELELR